MSGHSKWHSIRHKKAANDLKRGKVLTKHSKLIAVIARTDPDPQTNATLRVAVSNAKADGVPKDNIERLLKKLAGQDQAGVVYSEQLYEGYGPDGVPFLVSALTDNIKRTFPQVRTVFEKNGGKLAGQNAVKFLFDHVGVILVKTAGQTEEALFELVAECGAKDLVYQPTETEILTSFETLGAVRNALAEKGVDIIKSEPVYRSKEPQLVSDEEAEKLEKFIETIEALCEDVDEVYGGYTAQAPAE